MSKNNRTTKTVVYIKPYVKDNETRIKQQEFYYTGQTKSKNRTYLEYISRDGAAVKVDISYEDIRELKNLKLSNPEEYKNKYDSIIANNTKNTGIWDANGVKTEEEVEELKNKLLDFKVNKQHIWDMVISFDSLFVDQYEIFHPEVFDGILSTRLNQMLVKKGIKPDNAEWFFSFHKNTDNPHIHLGLFEKEANYNDKFTWKYGFEKDDIEEFKFNLSRDIVLKYENFKINDMLKQRQTLSKDFKDTLKYKNQFLGEFNWLDAKNVYSQISSDYEKIILDMNKFDYRDKFKNIPKYNYLSKEQKEVINGMVDEICLKQPQLKDEFDLYMDQVNIYQNATNEVTIGEEEKKENKDYYNNVVYGKDGIYSRLGNMLLQSLSRYGKINETNFTRSKKQKMQVNNVESLLTKFKDFLWAANKVAVNEHKETNKKIYNLRTKNHNERSK